MPLTTLDATSALIIIDLQKGIVALPDADVSQAVVANAAYLATEFRRRDLPVVLVNVAGAAPGRTEYTENSAELPADFFDLVAELDVHDDDVLVTKTRWGAFHGTDLHQFLQERGVTQTVLAGIATGIGVESTARAAHEHGYHVALATDAMTDMDTERHHNSVTRVFPVLGQTASTKDIVARLPRDPNPEQSA
ncbi:isochorismatase family protein [Streptomyces misionensis]|uniref:isochorismatase family protein n=1 Tax=Streptomyces misionensis TaxID=67331 RepID=UPI0033D3EE18